MNRSSQAQQQYLNLQLDAMRNAQMRGLGMQQYAASIHDPILNPNPEPNPVLLLIGDDA
jgi:hypothetical protein